MCDITGVSSDARAPRILKVGTDFSGMEMPLMALDKLGVAYEHRFSSDSARHCRTYIEAATQPGICYETVCGRNERKMPYVDTYVFSPLASHTRRQVKAQERQTHPVGSLSSTALST